MVAKLCITEWVGHQFFTIPWLIFCVELPGCEWLWNMRVTVNYKWGGGEIWRHRQEFTVFHSDCSHWQKHRQLKQICLRKMWLVNVMPNTLYSPFVDHGVFLHLVRWVQSRKLTLMNWHCFIWPVFSHNAGMPQPILFHYGQYCRKISKKLEYFAWRQWVWHTDRVQGALVLLLMSIAY